MVSVSSPIVFFSNYAERTISADEWRLCGSSTWTRGFDSGTQHNHCDITAEALIFHLVLLESGLSLFAVSTDTAVIGNHVFIMYLGFYGIRTDVLLCLQYLIWLYVYQQINHNFPTLWNRRRYWMHCKVLSLPPQRWHNWNSKTLPWSNPTFFISFKTRVSESEWLRWVRSVVINQVVHGLCISLSLISEAIYPSCSWVVYFIILNIRSNISKLFMGCLFHYH